MGLTRANSFVGEETCPHLGATTEGDSISEGNGGVPDGQRSANRSSTLKTHVPRTDSATTPAEVSVLMAPISKALITARGVTPRARARRGWRESFNGARRSSGHLF